MPRKAPAEPPPDSLLPLSPVVFSILLSLSSAEKHGYAIMKEVAEAEGGSLRMGPGTLYGSLDRMIRAALVEESGLSDDERRRYYRITRFGRKVLGAEMARLTHALKSARRRGILPAETPHEAAWMKK
jgi:DNA-binding PadR family transcriptional regulator